MRLQLLIGTGTCEDTFEVVDNVHFYQFKQIMTSHSITFPRAHTVIINFSYLIQVPSLRTKSNTFWENFGLCYELSHKYIYTIFLDMNINILIVN